MTPQLKYCVLFSLIRRGHPNDRTEWLKSEGDRQVAQRLRLMANPLKCMKNEKKWNAANQEVRTVADLPTQVNGVVWLATLILHSSLY